MNDIINELWAKAVDIAVPETYTSLSPEQIEKIKLVFAELIVRECANICMEMSAKCAGLPGDGALAKDCADWIKKDFGVEQ
jgi:hypothetical protein